ncbi:arylsulfotransferase family protein [Aspergillus stella-maris]|uniref:arylsulfotransferase family protein n=1 Tax=Aspergillus stella-maris TaxID=1810926 RepID=UPI003CCCD23A
MWHHVFLAIAILLNITHASRETEPVGEWPTELYRSSSVFGTAVYVARKSIVCKDGYTFLSPRGDGVAARGPTIIDQDGELIWASEDERYGAAYNLDVQTYKGENYLTFWEGYDKASGHGEGVLHMLDEQYIERYAIQGPNGESADLHEFRITSDDTALFTIYDVQQADLRPVRGPERGWIWDSRFVEVDIETNEVLFEWRASDHFNITDVTVDNPESSGWTYGHPKDFFHITSVDKDKFGNYLISALHNDHLTYLNGRTGSIMWKLGGNHTDFEDLSNGRASTFAWPHDARFTEDDAITLFDNTTPDDKVNRGLVLDVDQDNMTVKLRREYRAYGHDGVTPESQPQSDGSVQMLENGNVLVSYGRNGAAWTEFSEMGVAMCHTQFGSLSSFGSGTPASYRVKKHSWHGDPDTTPAFEIDGLEAYVSWNGATEVGKWVLEGAQVALPNADPHLDPNVPGHESATSEEAKSDTYFSAITTVKKQGFETKISIPSDIEHPYLRVRALDKKGLIMRTSAILPFHPTTEEPESPPPPPETESQTSPGLFFAGAFAALAIIACIFFVRRYCWSSFVRSCRRIRFGRRRFLPLNLRDAESNWEEYYASEEQEVGLHTVSDTESDDSDDVEISQLDNPRLSPALLSPNPNKYPRSPSFQSDNGLPMLIRTPSTRSTASSRAKQQ